MKYHIRIFSWSWLQKLYTRCWHQQPPPHLQMYRRRTRQEMEYR